MTDLAPTRRVPEPTVGFWVLKILTTGVGEVASDFLVKTFDPVVVVLVAAVAFAGVAAVQLSARRYMPWRYWLFVFAVAVFVSFVYLISNGALDWGPAKRLRPELPVDVTAGGRTTASTVRRVSRPATGEDEPGGGTEEAA